MSKEEMVIAIVAISCGTAIAISFFTAISKFANRLLDRKSGNAELNQKFFDDYIEFKRDVLSQLEYLKRTGQTPPKALTEKVEQLSVQDEDFSRESPRLKNMLSQKK